MLKVLRGLILLALLVGLCVSLAQSLIRDRSDALIDRGLRGVAPDPGIKVLLRDRAENRAWHSQLSLITKQAAIITSPDDPEAIHLELGPQQRVDIYANTADGMVISGPGLGEPLAVDLLRLMVVPARSSQTPGHTDESFEASDRGPVFSLGSRRYRGSLLINVIAPSRLAAVNYLPIEAWLEGVLATELADTWPRQVLEALAIAARSHAYAAGITHTRQILGGSQETPPWHLTDAAPSPTYDGSGEGGRMIDLAIARTRGLVLTHWDQAFIAWYHPASGGILSSIDDFKTGARTADGTLPLSNIYLEQPDPFYQRGVEIRRWEATHGRMTTIINHDDVWEALRTDPDIQHEDGWIYGISATRDSNDPARVRQVTLNTMRGEPIVLAPERFRQLLARNDIRSMVWDAASPVPIRADGDGSATSRWEITCYGRGHGVGMSLVSALAMATQGYTTRQILAFFYHETKVEQRW